MAYENRNRTTFTVENNHVIFIKPSKSTPTTLLSLSSIDNDPESNVFQQILTVFRSPNYDSAKTITKRDPANVIKQALSKALSFYYPLAGRIVRHADGKFSVQCNSDGGVPFTEAICNCNLSSLDYLDGNYFEMAKCFAIDFPSQDEFGNQYPLLLKVTKFLCGGYIFALSISHIICDGTGTSKFLHALAELANGKTEPSVKPVWEGETLVGSTITQPMQNLLEEDFATVSPFVPCTEFSHACIKVDNESIIRLKMSLIKERGETENNIEGSENRREFTTFESLAAYVWRARARALELSYDGKTMLGITVGVRSHLHDGYYGNAIVYQSVVVTVRELNERPLWQIVKLIRESLEIAYTNDFIKHSINSMETKPTRYDYETGAVMDLTDWRHLGFIEKVDFGWTEPMNVIPAPCNMVGLCMILPPINFGSAKERGVRVCLCLPSAAMPTFKEEMEALKLVHSRL